MLLHLLLPVFSHLICLALIHLTYSIAALLALKGELVPMEEEEHGIVRLPFSFLVLPACGLLP